MAEPASSARARPTGVICQRANVPPSAGPFYTQREQVTAPGEHVQPIPVGVPLAAAAPLERNLPVGVRGGLVNLLEIAENLKEGGTGLRSLGEPWADTTSPAGKVVLTVAAMAEFERALIHQRTSSGRVAARMRGVRFGRPPKLTPEQIALGRRLVDEGTSVRDVAKVILKRHPATLYRELGKFGPASNRANALPSESATATPCGVIAPPWSQGRSWFPRAGGTGYKLGRARLDGHRG